MDVKINFKKNMSGDYFVDNKQTFTKEEVIYIINAVKEKQQKDKMDLLED